MGFTSARDLSTFKPQEWGVVYTNVWGLRCIRPPAGIALDFTRLQPPCAGWSSSPSPTRLAHHLIQVTQHLLYASAAWSENCYPLPGSPRRAFPPVSVQQDPSGGLLESPFLVTGVPGSLDRKQDMALTPSSLPWPLAALGPVANHPVFFQVLLHLHLLQCEL